MCKTHTAVVSGDYRFRGYQLGIVGINASLCGDEACAVCCAYPSAQCQNIAR